MNSFPTYGIAPLLLACCGSVSLAAQSLNIVNVPFTGTIASTHDGKTVEMMDVARGSDGSTYEAEKTDDGRIFRVSIVNVPKNQRIVLYPSPPSYTYEILPVRDRIIRSYSEHEYRQQLQQRQDFLTEHPDSEQSDGTHHHDVALGSKAQDGMTVFASRDEKTSASGEKRITEEWQSDLGVTLKWVERYPLRGTIEIRTLINFRRVEPDRKLFEIPAEYLPHPDALLDAKTIFLDNQTGIPEITKAAAQVFKDWGRMRVTDSQEGADLIAVFTYGQTSTPEANDFPIEMTVHAPRSDTVLYTSHLQRNASVLTSGYSTNQLTTGAKNCVASLQNRIVNTHIGLLRPVSVAVPKAEQQQP